MTGAGAGRVVVVGSLNADLVATTDRQPADGETVHGTGFARLAGGKGLNQAVAAARAGAATSMVGSLGDDDLGTFLREQAGAAGVDLAAVRSVAGVPSGVAVITVDAAATNRIVVVAGANAATDSAWVDVRLPALLAPPAGSGTMGAGTVVLCQLETPLDGVLAALRLARGHGATTMLNSAPAPTGPLPPELLAGLDWLIPNEHEAALLLGRPVGAGIEAAVAAARQLQSLGPSGVVVTLGAQGAVMVTADGDAHHEPGVSVTAVDTTAAGDTFCGYLAASLAAGQPPLGALRRACAAGALATTTPGAVPSIPAAAAVEHLLARTRPDQR
jgi:ribokinase